VGIIFRRPLSKLDLKDGSTRYSSIKAAKNITG
jgi:hypothetical protein